MQRLSNSITTRTGVTPVGLPDSSLLGERAAVAGLTRRGPRSPGGAFTTMNTQDGWFGLSMPRDTDLALVPALLEQPLVAEPWDAVRRWARGQPTDELVRRARLLGLACAGEPGPAPPERPGVLRTPGGSRHEVTERPLVVDLTSLWAGPLCAHLLGLGGADVIKVESRRLDGARRGPRGFFDLLHAGHRMVTFDFDEARDRAALARLIARADLVLESSRPRALQHLGLEAEQFVQAGTSWLSITAHGRDSNTIGFGDDVAADAGLHLRDDADVLPCGDALADPLTGVVAAAAAAETLAGARAALMDVSMFHVSREAAGARTVAPNRVFSRGDAWWVEGEGGTFKVREPTGRLPMGAAAPPGADNDWVT